jgi:hypothetical protein
LHNAGAAARIPVPAGGTDQEVRVAIVKQLRVALANKPGALAELCSELAKKAVNISAIEASEAKAMGSVRLLVNQLETAKGVCDAIGVRYLEEQVLVVNINDRPGALGRVTRKLAEKGINIEYLYGSIEKGSKRALVVFGVTDVEAAARVAH